MRRSPVRVREVAQKKGGLGLLFFEPNRALVAKTWLTKMEITFMVVSFFVRTPDDQSPGELQSNNRQSAAAETCLEPIELEKQ